MIIESNIEALRAALVNGYVEDTLIEGLSTQDIASALGLFKVTAADVLAHPEYHGDRMTLEDVPPLFRRGLLIIASRVYRLATGKMSYIVPAMQRTMLQEAARMPSSHPSVEVARQATYQAVLRSNFPMAIEEPENEDVDGLEGDPAPDQDYHEGSPLALEVIAGLQPSHVEVAFDWTTNSSVGRRAMQLPLPQSTRLRTTEPILHRSCLQESNIFKTITKCFPSKKLCRRSFQTLHNPTSTQSIK